MLFSSYIIIWQSVICTKHNAKQLLQFTVTVTEISLRSERQALRSRCYSTYYIGAYSRCIEGVTFSNIDKLWQCESKAAEVAQSTTGENGIVQSVWCRKLAAHAQPDLWPFLKQNVITTDMSSTLCATASLFSRPALSCCPSSVVLERHQQQITRAEAPSLHRSAAYLQLC